MSSLNPHGSYTATKLQIYSWALGGIATNALICTYGQAMNLLTAGSGMNPATVAMAMMMPRIFDAVLDPFMGHLSDNTHTRWGRRKPFIILGAVLASTFLFMLWWVDNSWSASGKMAYLTLSGTLFYMSWGLYSMAWTALGYELSDDYSERSQIASLAGIVTSAVMLVNGGVYWFTLRPLFHHGVIATVQSLFSGITDVPHIQQVLKTAFNTVHGQPTDEINGIRWVTGGVVIASIGVAILVVKNCKERFAKAPAKQKHAPIFQALGETFKSKPFFQLMLFKLFQVFGERVFLGLLFYIGIYHVCSGDKSHYGEISFQGGLIGALLGFFVLPSLKGVSIKWGKRGGLIGCAMITFLLLLIQPFILQKGRADLLLIPLLLLSPLAVVVNSIIASIIPDICDQDELEHGERREGLFTSVVAFMGKLEISLSLAIVGLLTKLSGLDLKPSSFTNQAMQDLANQKLLWFAIVPGIVFTACALITAIKFKMDSKQVDLIRARLDSLRAPSGEA